ncbi:MAG: putative membrane protein [Flavobacteriales bacterium]|jgi:uncharacterized membrane protein
MSKKSSSPFKPFLGYFFKGLLVVVPIAATFYLVIESFVYIDGLIPVKFKIPGMGIVLFLTAITSLGFIASTVVAEPVIKYGNKLLNKVPLLKTLYTSIKDLLSAFVGTKKRFNEPVLVNVGSGGGLQKIGFITEKDLSDLGIPNTKIAVYLPHSYAFSGNLFIVDASAVSPIDAKASDVMKFIVSGGVTNIDQENI